MKILMLTWEYPPRVVGGIARVVYDLSHRLIKDGHEVTVVTYRECETQKRWKQTLYKAYKDKFRYEVLYGNIKRNIHERAYSGSWM